jgi:hypothetical protein
MRCRDGDHYYCTLTTIQDFLRGSELPHASLQHRDIPRFLGTAISHRHFETSETITIAMDPMAPCLSHTTAQNIQSTHIRTLQVA